MCRSIDRRRRLTPPSPADGEGAISKHSVKFAPSPPRLNHYESDASGDPTESPWYSPADYERFRADREADVARTKGRLPKLDGDEHCFWGLEKSLVPGLRRTEEAVRTKISRHVLAQLRRRPLECRFDSKICSAESKWSAEAARKKALFYSHPLYEGNLGGFHVFLPYFRPHVENGATLVPADGDASTSKKRVRFAPTATNVNHPKDVPRDFTGEIKFVTIPPTVSTPTWHSASDYERFRLDTEAEVSRMIGRPPEWVHTSSSNLLAKVRRYAPGEGGETCFWGLEKLLVPGLRRRGEAVRRTIGRNVLAEQQRQLREGRCDPESIAEVSRAESNRSAAWARKKASFCAGPLSEGDLGVFLRFADGDASTSKKRVRFSPTVTNLNHPRDASGDPAGEINFVTIPPTVSAPTWHSASDYERFRLDTEAEVSRMIGRPPEWIHTSSANSLSKVRRFSPEEKGDTCFWGLEKLLVPGLRERGEAVRRTITRNVLAEQRRQLKEGRLDPDSIADVSRTESNWSAAWARKKASFCSGPLSEGDLGVFVSFVKNYIP